MQILSIHGCDSTLHSSSNGLYVLVENELVNGMPLYKKEGGTNGQEGADAKECMLWWYVGKGHGMWIIGPAIAKGQPRGSVVLPEDAPLPHLGTTAWKQADTGKGCWKEIQAIKCVETPKVGLLIDRGTYQY